MRRSPLRTSRPSAGAAGSAPLTAAAVAAALGLAGCVGGDEEPAGASTGPTSSSAPAPSSTSTAPPSGTTAPPAPVESLAARLYWITADGGTDDDRPRLAADDRQVPLVGPDPVDSAVSALLAGAPADPDETSPWLPGEVEVARTGDDVVVDLAPSSVAGPAPAEDVAEAAVQQLLWTAGTALGTGGSVTVLVDGAPAQLWGRVEVGGATRPGPQEEVLAPVQITSPVEGAEAPAAGLAVSGTSSAPGGALRWAVTDAAGAVLAEGSTTGGADGEFADFAVTAPGLPTGGPLAVSVWVPDGSEDGPAPPAGAATRTFTVG